MLHCQHCWCRLRPATLSTSLLSEHLLPISARATIMYLPATTSAMEVKATSCLTAHAAAYPVGCTQLLCTLDRLNHPLQVPFEVHGPLIEVACREGDHSVAHGPVLADLFLPACCAAVLFRTLRLLCKCDLGAQSPHPACDTRKSPCWRVWMQISMQTTESPHGGACAELAAPEQYRSQAVL